MSTRRQILYKMMKYYDFVVLVQYFFSLTEGVHIAARVLLDIDFICFGYIARLSQWQCMGSRGYFTRSNDYHLPSLR
jgi:hypothetical protein